tara:strand:- start:212 stop:478 length:267 start_codon:yes stop_codon:yes gene_type:complete
MLDYSTSELTVEFIEKHADQGEYFWKDVSCFASPQVIDQLHKSFKKENIRWDWVCSNIKIEKWFEDKYYKQLIEGAQYNNDLLEEMFG